MKQDRFSMTDPSQWDPADLSAPDFNATIWKLERCWFYYYGDKNVSVRVADMMHPSAEIMRREQKTNWYATVRFFKAPSIPFLRDRCAKGWEVSVFGIPVLRAWFFGDDMDDWKNTAHTLRICERGVWLQPQEILGAERSVGKVDIPYTWILRPIPPRNLQNTIERVIVEVCVNTEDKGSFPVWTGDVARPSQHVGDVTVQVPDFRHWKHTGRQTAFIKEKGTVIMTHPMEINALIGFPVGYMDFYENIDKARCRALSLFGEGIYVVEWETIGFWRKAVYVRDQWCPLSKDEMLYYKPRITKDEDRSNRVSFITVIVAEPNGKEKFSFAVVNTKI